MFRNKLELSPAEGNRWIVTRPATYVLSSSLGHEIEIPAGFVTDLATIPGAVRWVFGKDLGRINRAGVLHDWLYSTHHYSRAVCDAAMYQALRQSGVARWRCKVIAACAHAFGKRAYRTAPKRRRQHSPNLVVTMGQPPAYERFSR